MPILHSPTVSDAGAFGGAGNVPPRNGLRILYAEDMRELREVARMSLARDGHSVVGAEDGAAALELISTDLNGFELVISDHHMPKLNGLELVAQLRALGYPGKIMIFSSELSREINAQYHRLNVDRILYKPVFPSTLRQVLAELYPPVFAGSNR